VCSRKTTGVFPVIVCSEAQAMICGIVFLKILHHHPDVSGGKYDKDNNNELFHRAIPFGWVSINHDRTISA